MVGCLFCKASLGRERAKEHVIPQWILEERNLWEVKLSRIRQGSDGTIKEARATQNLGSLVEGHICRSCNGGWMSSLESRAQPILRRLFDKNRIPQLGSRERDVVGKWAIKTAFMLNSSSNYPRLIRDQEFQHFCGAESIPPDICAFLAVSPFPKNIDWIESEIWESTLLASDRNMMSLTGWKIIVQIGSLCLAVAKAPDPRLYVIGARNIHLPLCGVKESHLRLDKTPHSPVSSSRDYLLVVQDTLEAIHFDYDGEEPAGRSFIRY